MDTYVATGAPGYPFQSWEHRQLRVWLQVYAVYEQPRRIRIPQRVFMDPGTRNGAGRHRPDQQQSNAGIRLRLLKEGTPMRRMIRNGSLVLTAVAMVGLCSSSWAQMTEADEN